MKIQLKVTRCIPLYIFLFYSLLVGWIRFFAGHLWLPGLLFDAPVLLDCLIVLYEAAKHKVMGFLLHELNQNSFRPSNPNISAVKQNIQKCVYQ